MGDNLNINDDIYKCSNTVKEFGINSAGEVMPVYEEVTVMKTEVKEECCDFEMPVDNTVLVNAKEEYISSPEIYFETGHTQNTEQAFNVNVDIGRCDLNQHLLDRHSAEPKRYKCEYDTHTKRFLEVQICTHTDDKPFNYAYKDCKCTPRQDEPCKCDAFAYAATDKTYLDQHIVERHNVEPKKYKCNDCEYSTDTNKHLLRHICTHTGDRPFKCTYKNCKCPPGREEPCECDTCTYVTADRSNLNRHVLIRHSAEPRRYKCQYCEYATYAKPALVIHTRSHTGDRPFKCPYKNCKCIPGQEELCECNTCEYAASGKNSLQKHVFAKHHYSMLSTNTTIILKSKKHKCNDCEYATDTKKHLDRHIRTHTGERPFKCTYKNCKCPHGQEEPCECDECEYVAADKSNFKRHILIRHSAKPGRYKCKDCEYATHTKTSLVIHARTHTGDRPFKCIYKNCKCTPGQDEFCKCDMCGYAASRKTTLQKHVLTKHTLKSKIYE